MIAQSDAIDAPAAVEACDAICREHGARDTARSDDPVVGANERALMRRIKACFDPNGILNPGKAH